MKGNLISAELTEPGPRPQCSHRDIGRSRPADAGADFVALGEAIWGRASPAAAVREAQALISGVGVNAP